MDRGTYSPRIQEDLCRTFTRSEEQRRTNVVDLINLFLRR